MHFFAKLVTALPAIAGIASAAVIPRAVDSDTMIAQLQDLTTKSSDTDAQAKQITPVNSFTSFPATIQGLRDLIQATTADAAAAADTQPFTDEDAQQKVCDAYDEFVKVQQAMLATLTGKAGLAAQTPFSAPIAASLRALEGVDDTFSFEVISAVSSCATAATDDKNKLDKSLEQAIKAYSN